MSASPRRSPDSRQEGAPAATLVRGLKAEQLGTRVGNSWTATRFGVSARSGWRASLPCIHGMAITGSSYLDDSFSLPEMRPVHLHHGAREIVDGERSRGLAIARTPQPRVRKSAMSSARGRRDSGPRAGA